MAAAPKALTPRSAAILRLIAAGHSYEQVLATDSTLTHFDIFAAAREALTMSDQDDNAYARRLVAIQEQYPRAYTPWSDDDDSQLRRLVETGQSVAEISHRLQRQPSAVRSRLQRLRLRIEIAPPTLRRSHNVTEFYGNGREGWDGTDAQDYVNKLRDEWDHRP
jgi:DNA-binding NarL/FixJ family response regulator